MRIDEITRIVGKTRGISPHRGKRIYDTVMSYRPKNILQLGFSRGVTTCYMAAAMQEIGSGSVRAIDSEEVRRLKPNIASLMRDTNLDAFIQPVFSRTGHVWELMRMIEENTVDGQCAPIFDFCFVEGSHSWETSGFIFFLVDKLLKPNSWIVFDDITWTYATSPSQKYAEMAREMSAEQRTTPQVGKVFSLLVRQHPSFSNFKDDGQWGWAKKNGDGQNCYCPVCRQSVDKFLHFASFGRKGRANAQCPYCDSLERHRLLWLYFEKKTNLLEPPRKKMLHIAPEKGIEKRLANHPAIDYLSGDLESPWHQAMVKMDITRIKYADNTFDVVYCSDVLEHIPKDRKAISELYRVLRPGGWAILNVPIIREETLEDPSIKSPEERQRHYGHRLHVRAYGKDYKDRLEQAGFSVKVDPFFDEFDKAAQKRYGLRRLDVYYCVKE